MRCYRAPKVPELEFVSTNLFLIFMLTCYGWLIVCPCLRAIMKTISKSASLRGDVVNTAMMLLGSTDGVCIECGEIVGGVEPDAEKYECEYCDTKTVYGAEQIILLYA